MWFNICRQQKINKNTKKQNISISELYDKNILLHHQNLVGVVKENKYLNCNDCSTHSSCYYSPILAIQSMYSPYGLRDILGVEG